MSIYVSDFATEEHDLDIPAHIANVYLKDGGC